MNIAVAIGEKELVSSIGTRSGEQSVRCGHTVTVLRVDAGSFGEILKAQKRLSRPANPAVGEESRTGRKSSVKE